MKRDPNGTDWRSSPITGSKDDAAMSPGDGKSNGENSGSRDLGDSRELQIGEPGCLSFDRAARDGVMDIEAFCCSCCRCC